MIYSGNNVIELQNLVIEIKCINTVVSLIVHLMDFDGLEVWFSYG